MLPLVQNLKLYAVRASWGNGMVIVHDPISGKVYAVDPRGSYGAIGQLPGTCHGIALDQDSSYVLACGLSDPTCSGAIFRLKNNVYTTLIQFKVSGSFLFHDYPAAIARDRDSGDFVVGINGGSIYGLYSMDRVNGTLSTISKLLGRRSLSFQSSICGVDYIPQTGEYAVVAWDVNSKNGLYIFQRNGTLKTFVSTGTATPDSGEGGYSVWSDLRCNLRLFHIQREDLRVRPGRKICQKHRFWEYCIHGH